MKKEIKKLNSFWQNNFSFRFLNKAKEKKEVENNNQSTLNSRNKKIENAYSIKVNIDPTEIMKQTKKLKRYTKLWQKAMDKES